MLTLTKKRSLIERYSTRKDTVLLKVVYIVIIVTLAAALGDKTDASEQRNETWAYW
jgi:hypothetical protein